MNRLIYTLLLLLSVALTVSASDYVFTPINVSNGLSDNQIRYILQLTDGRMVFTTHGNLNIYNGTHFKYIHRTARHIYPLTRYDGFYRIYRDGDSLLWIKDHRKLMCVDIRQEQYVDDLDGYFLQKGIHEPVEDFFMDSGRRGWLLTSGILKRMDDAQTLNLTDNDGALQDVGVTVDRRHLYLFYSTGEVVCYDIKTGNKLYTKAAYPESHRDRFCSTSLVVPAGKGFYQLRNGSKGGFFFFDAENHTWKQLHETPYTLNTLAVKDDTAYISCASGIWIINCRNGEKQYLPTLKTVDGNIIDTEISTLFFDNQGGFWLGTFNRGLLYYHPARYKFAYIGRGYFSDPSTKDVIVQAFAEDQTGNIYVKSSLGVYLYCPAAADGEPVLSPVPFDKLPEKVGHALGHRPDYTFKGNEYTALHTDSRGWTWAGTADGLLLFTPQREEGRFFYTEDGLSNNSVHGILEDHNRNLWVTTSYGISNIRVDSITGKVGFINFNTYDGTLHGEYTGAALEASDGTLYFGGINGFNILKSNHISDIRLPFQPVFTNLFLRGVAVEPGKIYDDRVILPEASACTDKIELAHNQNFLTFEFSAMNYQNPSQTRYRYQLEGIDADWREALANEQHTESEGILRAVYTNLPPGKYLFKVKASPDGRQWEDVASWLQVIIHAPWWETTSAYILYFVFSVLGLSAGIWFYLFTSRKKMERRHNEEMLLLRIRNLIEQNKLLEKERESVYTQKNIGEAADEKNLSYADNEFLTQAIALVEKNINEPNYSVEMLSRDLCMDRTGLYRKLIALLDKSPSLFIRNIRLQKAAQLILQGELNIGEIAERVGFSSPSYLTKCFQEVYGCKPSEYRANAGD